MRCTKCSFEFEEGIFCPECGTKYDEAEAKRIAKEQEVEKEHKRQDEKEKRELELAKIKAEHERLAKEKAEKEAELLRLKNENIRIEQEAAAKKAADEKQRKEEMSRTFNGVLYSTVEDMNVAKAHYEENEAKKKATKQANTYAIVCFILAIATYPLLITLILWFPSLILSIVFGVMAIVKKSTKRGLMITGLIFDGIFLAIAVFSVVTSF